jgi:hypothetical protein
VQLAAAISAVVQNAAISGNFGFTRDHLKSILGTDLNSTLTVSRAVDNVVKVRLGAPRQPTAGYAMIPRNHTISVLVLADVDPKSERQLQRSLQILTKTSLRDAETGKPLPYAHDDVFAGARESLRRILGFQASSPAGSNGNLDNAITALVPLVQGRDVINFKTTLVRFFGSGADESGKWEPAWTALSETSGSTEFQSTSVVLPTVTSKPTTVRPPAKPAPAPGETPKPTPAKPPAEATTTTIKTTKTETTTTTTTANPPTEKNEKQGDSK